MKNYYQFLNIPQEADRKAIRSAYKKLAVQYHPDKNPDNPAAEEQFKRINEAYQVLSDEHKKEGYDQQLKAFLLNPYPELEPPNTAFQRRNMAYYHERNYNRPRFIRETELSDNQRFKAWAMAGMIVFCLGAGIVWLAYWQKQTATLTRYQEGLAFMKKGFFQEAEYRFNEVLHLQKDHAGAYFQKGLLYADAYRIYDQALHCFNKAIDLSDNARPDMYFKRGFCLYQLAEYKKAEQDFTSFIDSQELLKEKSDLLGEAYFYRGACRHLLYPQMPEIQRFADWKTAAKKGYKRAADSLCTAQ